MQVLARGAKLNLDMDDTSVVVPELEAGTSLVNAFHLDDLDSTTHRMAECMNLIQFGGGVRSADQIHEWEFVIRVVEGIKMAFEEIRTGGDIFLSNAELSVHQMSTFDHSRKMARKHHTDQR
jgi:hypothetical protein